MRWSVLALSLAVLAVETMAAEPRARDLGIPFSFGTPGKWNAITDVPGVAVGHVTLIEGEGVRTGVTAVMPRGNGDEARRPCFGGMFSLNGDGEMTGSHRTEEFGLLDGPVMLTNTNSVGVVRDALSRYAARRWPPKRLWTVWSIPVVAETWDGPMNDIYGFHVRAEHAFQAIDGAASGPVAEGSVGGGTGMDAYEFKAGIGTASRVLAKEQGGYTVGVLVQANHGLRHQLLIAGIPVGLELPAEKPRTEDSGSIIIVVATDAPLLPHQTKRLARRASLGLARTGSVSGNTSGDLFVAFSTANPRAGDSDAVVPLEMLANDRMGPLFEAVVGATEEAIVNALVAGRTMTGHVGTRVVGLPHDKVQAILKRHAVLQGR
ncbi:MAG TPA: P1 family peptidase [Vicinamibacteria bacterium]|nr:P1 family peptidase [Vicinamibacteria bacterium]